jgi:hypothetical protein
MAVRQTSGAGVRTIVSHASACSGHDDATAPQSTAGSPESGVRVSANTRFPEDPGALAALREFDGDPAALLGRGGEASVYALDDEHVLRVARAGATGLGVRSRAALLDELRSSVDRLSFSIPRVLEVDFVHERWCTVERRLLGRPLEDELAITRGTSRVELVRRYLSAVAELGELAIARPFWGELHEGDAVRAETWRGYLERRARLGLELGGADFSRVNAGELATPFDEPSASGFVYLDVYPGNVLVHAGRVSAVLDFGGGVLIGDPRFNALGAASYLHGADRAAGEAWLAERGLGSTSDVRRWLAAYWAFARDDEKLSAWCRAELSLEERATSWSSRASSPSTNRRTTQTRGT